MPTLKEKFTNKKGFMIIIAMIMFAIMSYWSIAAMKRNIQTITNTKNTNLYYRATAIADSMMEYLQYTVKKEHTSGYNLALKCNYGKYKTASTVDNPPQCKELLVDTTLIKETGDNVKVKLTIKGRSDDGEKFKNCGIGGFNDCYVTPFPGTGDASEQCKGYKPKFDDSSKNDATSNFVNHNGKIVTSADCPGGEGIGCVNQLDYACNWNKLQFGSTLLDRAVIPFYYDNGDGVTIKNPFNTQLNGNGTGAENFVLRIRTPCKPCDERFSSTCNSSADPTICRDSTIAVINDRYELKENENDATPNDIVVQWQLTGQCGAPGKEDDEECGLIQYKNLQYLAISSAITESRINGKDSLSDALLKDHTVLYSNVLKSQQGMDTNIYSETDLKTIFEKLSTWTKPILSLFLGEKLKPVDGNRLVPYLEYQVLSDKPIANPKIQMDVFVNVDGIGAKKTLYKEEQKQLIDFAIQN